MSPIQASSARPTFGIGWVRKAIDRFVTAYQEELITIDELRNRTPELRRQEQALHRELQSTVDRAKDRETYLRLAETLTGFLARLRSSAETLDIAERQRIVPLLVKEILVTEDKITIRHSISPGADPSRPDNGGPEGESYLLRSGRRQPLPGERLPALRDWFQNHWRKRMTDTIIVRYADDFVCGFQDQGDAKRWDLGERLAHLNCTRTIIEFGRFARANRRKRGQGVRLPRYDALLRADEEGQVQGRPQTIPETGTLRRIKEALRKRWHDNRHKTAKWRVIKGCYYAVPGSSLREFIYQCKLLRALRRRSQKDRTDWRVLDTLIAAH